MHDLGILGVAWAGGIAYAAYRLIDGIGRMAAASRQGYSDSLAAARRRIVASAVSVVALAAVAIMYAMSAAG